MKTPHENTIIFLMIVAQSSSLYKGDMPLYLRDLTDLAKKGSAEARYLLGLHFHSGYGKEQSCKLASFWMMAAAKDGHGHAQTRLKGTWADNLHNRFFNEQPTPWQDEAVAACAKALCHEQGLTARQKPELETATSLFEKALTQNPRHSHAYYKLAEAHELGIGVPCDDEQALRLYWQSAEIGHVGACLRVYYWLKHEDDCNVIAMAFLKSGCNAGDAISQYELATCYLYGHSGCNLNREKGMKLLRQSARSEYPEAVDLLARLESGGITPSPTP